MKNVLFSLAALALIAGTPSYAKEKKVTTTTTTTYEGGSSGSGSFWLGVTSDTFASASSAVPGLTALIGFNDKTGLQLYAVIETTTPKFLFAVGGNIKYNAVGNWAKGFHVGGGFGLGQTTGTGSAFGANIYGLMGPHWQPTDGVLLSCDGGLGVTIGSGTTFFRMGTNSAMIGASALFRL